MTSISVTYGTNGDGLPGTGPYGRAWKQVGENARTYYLYDGETLLAELTPTGTLSAINTWGANGLVARWTTAGVIYYQYDNLGNVSDRLDASQNVTSSDLYDAYGVRQIGTSTDPYGYKGQYGYYTDRETGLILCTYRYYDPASGGWLTRDPIGFGGGMNLYGYVGGNPVNWVDPSGLRVYKVTKRNPASYSDYFSPDHVYLVFTKYGGKVPSSEGWGYGFYPGVFPPASPGIVESPKNSPNGDHNTVVPLCKVPSRGGKVTDGDFEYYYELLHPDDDEFERRLAERVQKASLEGDWYTVIPLFVCWSWVDMRIVEAEYPRTPHTPGPRLPGSYAPLDRRGQIVYP